ncbi:MAG TPA: YchJ family metal-binding protein [Dyella sp.]|uniref:YchJ family protein n=1 Tax=Dyella sp. TaxID=1869338 RepID=UPI002C55149E|nr:YchJ family metal-binding protein [Dyella sp.]HTV85120.1 YchJ family metal-binding protein [Dyella sp.]
MGGDTLWNLSLLQAIDTLTPCPCGNNAGYAHCCGPLHGGAIAHTAEVLMRSRYSAYVMKREDYLLATWHPSTRPASLKLAAQQPAPTWLGLDVKRHEVHGERAVVEFVARLRYGGGKAQRMHEISSFVREQDRWYYLDGRFPED